MTAGLTDGKLTGSKVAIVTMPNGRRRPGRTSSRTSSRRPARQVTTRVSLDSKLFDPGQRQLVEPLVNELVTADVDVPEPTARRTSGPA